MYFSILAMAGVVIGIYFIRKQPKTKILNISKFIFVLGGILVILSWSYTYLPMMSDFEKEVIVDEE
nr:hypothetical protein [Evansella caseinilytica]